MRPDKALLLLFFCLSFPAFNNGQTQQERLFVFGHSLVHHDPPLIATPSNETTVPHWLFLMAQENGHTLNAGGKYGFLPQHANDAPFSQWGYDIVPGVWESDTETFAEANVSTVMITAGNFVQWQAPDQEYPGDPGITPINATETVFDWVRNQTADTRLIIYENWPDMAGFLANDVPAAPAEFAAYNDYTRGDFHDWWIDYHDALRASRPNYDIKMVPVGPILADILESDWANQIPFSELYEDNAPHGRATLYFLAALVTYPAIYQEAPPAGFTPPSIVHQQIRDNYTDIAAFVMEELNAFNDGEGISRVFCDVTLPVALSSFTAATEGQSVVLDWATSTESDLDRFEVQRRNPDNTFATIGTQSPSGENSSYQLIDEEPFVGENIYRLRMLDLDGAETFSSLVTATVEGTNSIQILPLGGKNFGLYGVPANSQFILVDVNGRVASQGKLEGGDSTLYLDGHTLPGIYFLMVEDRNGLREILKLILR